MCKGSTADSDSVCLGSNPSTAAKKERSICFVLFLSNPKDWYGINAPRALYGIRRKATAWHHAIACIFLRLDDIQCFALMICRNKLRMIYTPHGVIGIRMTPIITKKSLLRDFFYSRGPREAARLLGVILIFYIFITLLVSIARCTRPSTSSFFSSASICSNVGRVRGCLGVNTVQQSS